MATVLTPNNIGTSIEVNSEPGKFNVRVDGVTVKRDPLTGAVTVPGATQGADGLFSAADKIKLDTVSAYATNNYSNAYLLDRANHTGVQDISTIDNLQSELNGKADASHTHVIGDVTGLQTALDDKVDIIPGYGLSEEDYSTADKNKLAGIDYGATANSPDVYILDRGNHTGTQDISTVTGLQAALNGKQDELVSGTNIKTINGISVLGSGNMVISGGGGGGSGDVVGPGLSVDGHIAVFDGVSGYIIKDGGPLDKAAVGLGNVDNTSDLNKPVSTAQQSALDLKQDELVSGTNIKTINSTSLLGTGNIVIPEGDVAGPNSSTDDHLAMFDGTTGKLLKDGGALNKAAVGLGNVDNTSDADKPVSTAQQSALNLKQDVLVSGTDIKTINGNSILGSGNMVISGGGGGAGDVVGPASAVDSNIAVFDTTTGKLIKDGGSTVASLGVSAQVQTTSSKATPVNADKIPLLDSANSYNLKWLTWQNLKAALAALFVPVAPAILTYFVRSDGSDSNNGLANTSGGAFLTIQKAFDTVKVLRDHSSTNVTINVGAGTFAGVSVDFRQIPTCPNNVSLVGQPSSATVVGTLAFSGPKYLYLENLAISTPGIAIDCRAGVTAQLNGSMVCYGGGSRFIYSSSATIIVNTDLVLSGNLSFAFFQCDGPFSNIQCINKNISVGTVNFTNFAAIRYNSVLNIFGCNFSGSPTGIRYSVSTNSVIFTDGGGSSYLPGSTAGTETTGGVYA